LRFISRPGAPARARRRPLDARALLHALDLEPVLDVLAHGHVREERVVLEHGVHVAGVGRLRGHVGAFEQDAPFVRRLEAGDQAERRRLPGARRAEHREELAGGYVELDAVDRDDVAVRLADVFELDVSRLRRRQATPPGSRDPGRDRRRR
jgi:hypothetical protein